MTGPLTVLTGTGVSIWLDDLSRDRLTSGNLADLVANDHVVGVTTNPTIFARAIASGHSYDTQVRGLAARGVGVGEALRALPPAMCSGHVMCCARSTTRPTVWRAESRSRWIPGSTTTPR